MIEEWQHPSGFRWDHVKLDVAGRAWLDQSGLDPLVIEALAAPDTRPRATFYDDGAVVFLRGVNTNEGAEAEDMVSVRMWVEPGRVVSVWLRPLRAVAQLRSASDLGSGPDGPGAFVSQLALNLSETAAPVISDLADRVDALEESLVDPAVKIPRAALTRLRRTVIALRRYFSPQRDALSELHHVHIPWITDQDRDRLAEATDRMARLTEELEALGHRTQVLQDHIAARQADDLNRQMYLLSVVAALFLPLGFVTGLLGVNVGGLPGTHSDIAFWIVCALMVALGLLQWWIFRAAGIVRRGDD
ncbi:zinc transporter ZntB [Aliishimia ponticola]|nr:zinc transporter ZntB [Aliishimia ponticola]